MPIAVTAKNGSVTIADARRATLQALRALERTIKFRLAEDQFGAFKVGGHQLHGGRKWKSLAASTIGIKIREGSPTPMAPLVRTGAMSGLSRVKVDLDLVGNSIRFRVWAWNEAPYSGYHMKPSWNKWAGKYNPMRRPVEITRADLDWARNLILAQLGFVQKVEQKPTLFNRMKGAAGGFLKKLFRRGK